MPASTVTEIEELGITVTRIGGPDPLTTGVAVSQAAIAAGHGALAQTWLATSRVFADALSAGAAAAATRGTLLLVDGLDAAANAPVAGHLAAVEDQIAILRLAGGVAAIDPAVEEGIRASLR